ncbi:MAG: hypothetical protein FJ358_02585 [Thaumarchaeota archaeon]|nr:hypothetical protein [Nitrososphaerota archaeon]
MSQANSEAQRLNSQVQGLNSQIQNLNNERSRLQSDLTVAKNNASSLALEVARLKTAQVSKNITVIATGQGTTTIAGNNYRTTRVLEISVSATDKGWVGTGYYAVMYAETDSNVGIYQGQVFILDLIAFYSVTLSGNNAELRGMVYITDRVSITYEKEVTVTVTDQGQGFTTETVTFRIATDTPFSATLTGRVDIYA